MRRTPLASRLLTAVGLCGLAASSAGAANWTIGTHPCPGANRTDALHRDEDGRLWVGCGTNATGYGLFHSDDGLAWSAATTTPAGVLETFRVSSIETGHDGALYVAGTSSITGNRAMVYRVDPATEPMAVTLTLEGVNQVGRQFHVGNYRELWDGRAIAEDLNGTWLLYRPDASTGTSASDWTRIEGAYQILDLQGDGDRFIGGGGRINEPPRLFLPPLDPGDAPWDFVTFALPTVTGWDGEIWGVARSYDKVIAVGVDQDEDIGKIFVSGDDPYVVADYVERSVDDFLAPGPGYATWARGVCSGGDLVAVVGERQPLAANTGFVLVSFDRGATFQDMTPPGVTASVSKCVVTRMNNRGDAGGPELIVAGAGGFVGLLAGDVIFENGFD